MSNVTIPLPPNGVNPYSFYLNLLDLSFYTPPTRGFSVRLAILFGLNASAIILGLLYLWVLHKNTRESLWLFRLVKRSSGRYIASNQNLWSAIMTIITSGVILGNLQDGYRATVHHGAQTWTPAWRGLSFIPLSVFCYIVSFAILQSFLLTRCDRQLFSARVANISFIGIGSVLLCGLLASGLAASITGETLWSKYVIVAEQLRILEPSWDGRDVSIVTLIQLEPLLKPLYPAAESYATAIYVQACVISVVAIVTSLINFGSIALYRVLRKQININYERYSADEKSNSSQTSNDDVNEIGSNIRKTSTGWKSWMEGRRNSDDSNKNSWRSPTLPSSKNNTVPSRSQIRRIAKDEENGLEAEQAKKIMNLQKAERDLLFTSSFLLFLCFTSSALVIWITVRLQTRANVIVLDAPTLEVACYGIEWIYGVSVNLVLPFLIYNSYAHLSDPVETAADLTLPLSPPEMTELNEYDIHSVFSLAEMFGQRGDVEADKFTIDSRRPTFASLEVVVEVEVAVKIDEAEREVKGGKK